MPLSPAFADIDWEAVLDFPHGSLRLLGCRKAPWMDKDPDWVTEKYYSPVVNVCGTWWRLPLTRQALHEASIHPTAKQLEEYEASQEFLDAMFLVRG
jgi:hypothetical protein